MGKVVKDSIPSSNNPTDLKESLKAVKDDWAKVKESWAKTKKNWNDLKKSIEKAKRETPVEKSFSYDLTQHEVKQKGDYFVRAWWSTDFDGKEEVKSIITGEKLYLNVQTKNIPDHRMVKVRLFNDRTLVVPDQKPPEGEEIRLKIEQKDQEDKFIVEHVVWNSRITGDTRSSIRMNFSEDYIRKQEECRLKISFICTYIDPETDIQYNQKLPESEEDMLWVYPTFCIDRYKMPGLNRDGSDIADDMTFGRGLPTDRPIYLSDDIQIYIDNYKKTGFDLSRDAVFSNAKYYQKPEIDAMFQAPKTWMEISMDKMKRWPEHHKAIYSEHQILNEVGYSFLMNMTNEIGDEDINVLFDTFTAMGKYFFSPLSAEMRGNIQRMVEKFKRNEGGIYEDLVLTKNIIENENTIEYCNKVNKYIADKVKEHAGHLIKFEDNEPDFDSDDGRKNRNQKRKSFTKPQFPISDLIDNTLQGLTIALNDIWATQVIMKGCIVWKNGNYTARYEVTLWDHFGLDEPDLRESEGWAKKVVASGAGFRAWFILQHLKGYRPFLTKVVFEKGYTGNMKFGKAEIEAIENAQKEAEAEQRASMNDALMNSLH